MQERSTDRKRVAVVTGASQGLGKALAAGLARQGWALVIDARHVEALAATVVELREITDVIGIAGDVTDPAHRLAVARAASDLGPVGLVVNNASTLGASPLPRLADIDPDVLRGVFDVNVVAPIALVQTLGPVFSPGAIVVNITSDAAVEAYGGWGGYGASKAALEHASRVLAVERPDLRVLVVDPGDMRTQMHQDAFPDEDISDRPDPLESVPGLLALIDGDEPSGRYEAQRGGDERGGCGMTTLTASPARSLDFRLDPSHEAHVPAEARGLRRDDVRLLVSEGDRDPVDAQFHDLGEFLRRGDLLVVNTSATVPAALDGCLPDGEPVVVHLSSLMPGGLWLVEVRRPERGATSPRLIDHALDVELLGRGQVGLLAPYETSSRLWWASLDLPELPLARYLEQHGRPIRYRHVPDDWPLSTYQTVFARDPGSAEMPSASRPFTTDLVTELVSRGVEIAPVLLHTGVSSLEGDERPYPERYDVSRATATVLNTARRHGGRVVAAGTTVVRALATVTDDRGVVHPGQGWTDTVVTPESPVPSVDGLITGWHEPESSHLLMLEAFAGRPALSAAYAAALDRGYLWHEFGDSHLILRERRRGTTG